MNQMPLDQLTKVIKDAFNGAAKITKSFQTFFIETMILYLSIPKRINFMQMSRFGDSCESRFRQYFQREFDWVGYNSEFISHMSGLRMDVFQQEGYDDGEGKTVTLYTAIVRATSLKRDVRVVIVHCTEPGKKTQTRKVFFSTDTEMSAKEIMDIYRTRFQIEFLLRDSKQYTGLTHCQSRQKEALAFHFNMSLTAVNVARAFARQDNRNLSVANVKTLIHNAKMIHRFSVLSGKLPNKLLNTNDFKELLYYGIANAA